MSPKQTPNVPSTSDWRIFLWYKISPLCAFETSICLKLLFLATQSAALKISFFLSFFINSFPSFKDFHLWSKMFLPVIASTHCWGKVTQSFFKKYILNENEQNALLLQIKALSEFGKSRLANNIPCSLGLDYEFQYQSE